MFKYKHSAECPEVQKEKGWHAPLLFRSAEGLFSGSLESSATVRH